MRQCDIHGQRVGGYEYLVHNGDLAPFVGANGTKHKLIPKRRFCDVVMDDHIHVSGAIGICNYDRMLITIRNICAAGKFSERIF
eukprot:SAG31_NODE_5473_length_2519_cov_1.478099_2_plen_84_part_00